MRKNKDVVDRIAYYTRKVAQKGAVHPAKIQPAAFTYRHERLMLYKKLMHAKIETERFKQG